MKKFKLLLAVAVTTLAGADDVFIEGFTSDRYKFLGKGEDGEPLVVPCNITQFSNSYNPMTRGQEPYEAKLVKIVVHEQNVNAFENLWDKIKMGFAKIENVEINGKLVRDCYVNDFDIETIVAGIIENPLTMKAIADQKAARNRKAQAARATEEAKFLARMMTDNQYVEEIAEIILDCWDSGEQNVCKEVESRLKTKGLLS